MHACIALAAAIGIAGCGSNSSGPGFQQTNLVSNNAGAAPVTDPDLLNPWGLARSASGPWWVADNQAGVSTRYDAVGNRVPIEAVTIPPPAASPGTASRPTGVVFNDTDAFVISAGDAEAPASFIFATEDGTISAWSEQVDPANAILVVDNSTTGAIYKGLASGTNVGAPLLYATNFSAGTVDVFDRDFAPALLPDAFIDPNIPTNFSPFGIQNINGDIFVTYAKRSANGEDDVPGNGNGYVSVFDTNGAFVRRFASQGQLNSPWGMVQAPVSFGRLGGAILIGNVGDGHLNAFNPVGGTFLGQLNRPNGDALTIEGLWGLGFGNGGTAGTTDTLYFTAGPNDQRDGLFGLIEAAD